MAIETQDFKVVGSKDISHQEVEELLPLLSEPSTQASTCSDASTQSTDSESYLILKEKLARAEEQIKHMDEKLTRLERELKEKTEEVEMMNMRNYELEESKI